MTYYDSDSFDSVRVDVLPLMGSVGVEYWVPTPGTLAEPEIHARIAEALGDVAEKRIDGFGELFRWISFQKIGTSTVQSRADAGVLTGTYIFVLPGSPGACRDGWDDILRDQLDIRHKPCNFAELLPRLREHEGRESL